MTNLGILEKWMKEIDEKLNNHLIAAEKEMGNIRLHTEKISNDVDWIKRFFWLITSVSITSIGGVIMSFIMK